MTTSLPPAGVPTSGNQKYIAVAVVLLLLVGGLVWWKTRSTETPQVSVTPPTVPTQTADPHRDDDIPPPIAIPTVTASAAKSAVANGGPASNGCEAKVCKGSAGDDLQSALALRGRQARKCYERELANDPKLAVRMTMSVRIGTNGAACAANVASSDNPTVSACVANFFRNGGYPGAKGGCAEVNVPLNFIPGK